MANEGVAPPQFDTPVGKVRLLTSDTDATNVSDGQGEYVWSSDKEIEALLVVTGSPARAAIRILRLVAMTPALQYKKWSSADLSVDGPAISRALRDLINDAEKALEAEDGLVVGEFFAQVPTGPAMAQPARYPSRVPQFNGEDIDPTIPWSL